MAVRRNFLDVDAKGGGGMKAALQTLVDQTTAEILDKMRAADLAGERAVVSVSERVKLCVEVGRLLLRKKSELAHGHFMKWFGESIECTQIAREMQFSDRTARRWMKLAEEFDAGRLKLGEATSLKRVYQLAGVLPEAEEGEGGGSGPEVDEPLLLVRLKRMDSMLQSELVRHPLDKWTSIERTLWRERLKPFAAFYNALDSR